VLTHEKYRDANLTEEHKKEFFETGRKYANRIYRILHTHFDENFSPESVFDFGCGTGRLAIGFAPNVKRVVGLDISENMLQEAEANAKEMGQPHIEFYMSDDTLSAVANQQFDLVNCYIVLQHINLERGYAIIQELVNRVKTGGFGVMQLNYTCQKGRLGTFVDYFRYRIPLVHGMFNVLQKRPFNEPLMQMNAYDLNKVFYILQKSGVKDSHLQYEKHGDCWGVTIFFQKL
jgi:ubiquinone/menaquinone biosynthesis C-methylase UbiE